MFNFAFQRLATELVEFGGISDESLFEGEFTNVNDEKAMDTNRSTNENDVSFTPAGSQFGEIGERIRSAKAGSRMKPNPSSSDNPMIMPLNSHL